MLPKEFQQFLITVKNLLINVIDKIQISQKTNSDGEPEIYLSSNWDQSFNAWYKEFISANEYNSHLFNNFWNLCVTNIGNSITDSLYEAINSKDILISNIRLICNSKGDSFIHLLNEFKKNHNQFYIYLLENHKAISLLNYFYQTYLNSNSKEFIKLLNLNKIDELDSILLKGINVNYYDNLGFTPLMHAAIKDRVDVIIKLMQNGAELEQKDMHHHQTAFEKAILSNSFKTVNFLIAIGINQYNLDITNQTILHKLVENNNMIALSYLMAHPKRKIDIDVLNKNNLTPLMLALEKNNIEASEILLDNQANFNASTKDNLKNPLSIITKNIDNFIDLKNIAKAKELLNFAIKHSGKLNELHKAILIDFKKQKENHFETLNKKTEPLLFSGKNEKLNSSLTSISTDVIKETKDASTQRTPEKSPRFIANELKDESLNPLPTNLKLTETTAEKSTETSTYLKKEETKYEHIQEAVFKNDLEAIRNFIKNGSDVNSLVKINENNQLLTILMYSIMFNKFDVAKLLIESDAKINIVTSDTKDNLLHLVLKNKEAKDDSKKVLINILVNKGANLEWKNLNDETPVESARKLQLDSIIPFLEELLNSKAPVSPSKLSA